MLLNRALKKDSQVLFFLVLSIAMHSTILNNPFNLSDTFLQISSISAMNFNLDSKLKPKVIKMFFQNKKYLMLKFPIWGTFRCYLSVFSFIWLSKNQIRSIHHQLLGKLIKQLLHCFWQHIIWIFRFKMDCIQNQKHVTQKCWTRLDLE